VLVQEEISCESVLRVRRARVREHWDVDELLRRIEEQRFVCGIGSVGGPLVFSSLPPLSSVATLDTTPRLPLASLLLKKRVSQRKMVDREVSILEVMSVACSSSLF
jgi:hypothetical protein